MADKKTLTEKTEQDTSTAIRFIEGGLVNGKLERGADGIKRMYIKTSKKDEKYYFIGEDLKSDRPIYCPTP